MQPCLQQGMAVPTSSAAAADLLEAAVESLSQGRGARGGEGMPTSATSASTEAAAAAEALQQCLHSTAALPSPAQPPSESYPTTPTTSATETTEALQPRLRVDFTDLQFYSVLGKGSYKTVYKGRWRQTTVAIVCMRRGGPVREARIMQRLHAHPNLVQFCRQACVWVVCGCARVHVCVCVAGARNHVRTCAS